MANEHLDDHELGELVKKWIIENGPAIVVGIVLGAIGLSGWRYWETYQLDAKYEAAREYQQLVSELEADGAQATTARLNAFTSEHRSPGYQGLAALQLAAKAVKCRREILKWYNGGKNGTQPSLAPGLLEKARRLTEVVYELERE